MFCPQCGSEVNGQFKFCFNCGFNLQNINTSGASPVDNDVFNGIQFNGSLERFNEICEQLLYEKEDFVGAFDFITNAAAKFPNQEYTPPFSIVQIAMLHLIKNNINIDQDEFIDVAMEFSDDPEDIEKVSGGIAQVAVGNFFGRIWTFRLFKLFQFFYLWGKDQTRYVQLNEELNNLSSSNSARGHMLEGEIETLNGKWGGFGQTNYIRRTVDTSDLTHISTDFNAYYKQCVSYVDFIYEKFLNNAIRIHNAGYLESLRPTAEQKERIRNGIKNKLLETQQFMSPILSLTHSEGDKCIYLATELDRLNNQYSGKSLMKKGVMTAGLAFMAGPLGLVNAFREVYNYSENSKAIDERTAELEQRFNKFLEEYDKTTAEYNRLWSETVDFILEYGKNTLCAALNNIVEQLRSNGETLQPLKNYLK